MIRAIRWAVVLAAVAAAAAVQSPPTQARWRILNDDAINDQKLCRDGLQFSFAQGQTDTPYPTTPPPGTPTTFGPVTLEVDAAPHGTPDFAWPNDTDIELVHSSFTANYKATAQTINGTTSYYNYFYKSTVPFTTTAARGFAVRLVPLRPGDTLDDATTPVIDPVPNCFLWGPIDIAPGDPTNTIDPASRGEVKVALFSSRRFDATGVTGARFGEAGTEARPVSRSHLDLNQDGIRDELFSFKIADTGITCGTPLARLSAASKHLRFYEQDVVHTTC